MPRQVFTINDFSGGLNTTKSDRALEDNELAECTNLDASSKGVIRPSRIFDQTSLYGQNSSGTEVDPGYGLFTFSNDSLISNDETTNIGQFIVFNGGATEIDALEVTATGVNTSAWQDNIVADGGDVQLRQAFYAAEGDLFVGGENTSSVLATPVSLVFHKQTQVPSAGGGVPINIWKADTQAKPIPVTADMEIVESDGTGTAYNSATGKGQEDLIWILKVHDDDGDTTDSDGLWTNDHDGTAYYEYAASWLYKNNAESDLVKIQNHSDDGTSYLFADDDDTEAGMRGASSFDDRAIQIQCWINSATPTTEALSYARYGARLYSRLATDEGDWYLLAEMHYEKGIKGDGETEWNPWIAATGSSPNFDHGTTGDQCTTGLISAPPALLTYNILNGLSTGDIPDSNRTGAKDRIVKWKTGLVANSRAYIGNVEINGRAYGDRILKSPIYQYDVFTEDSYLDVAINDGDQLTALAAYGDRIIQFKNSAAYVINVSKELEFLEDEQQGAGVAFQAAVTNTPFGVIWVNTNGCYLYDGDNITQLQMDKISDADWGNVTSRATIGFDSDRQQVIILWDSNAVDDAFIFDVGTGGWYQSSDIIPTTKHSSNMANARGDKLLVGGGATVNDINFLQDRTSSFTCSLKSKVFDFGNPESKKNLLEVAVTYNGKGHASLDFDIITDDGTSTKVDALDNTSTNVLTEEFNESGTAALQGQKTYQIHINGSCDVGFELYSITLTYRDLGVH